MGLVNFADEASEQCEICRAFDKAAHMPIAGHFHPQRLMGNC